MKFRFSLSLLLLITVTINLSAQNKIHYASFLIPDSLKKDALAVLREQTVNLVISQPGKGKKEVKSVITVLSETGKKFQVFSGFYDQFQKLEDIEINAYDAAGVFMKRYKRRDLEKVAIDDGMSLVNDIKVLYGVIATNRYPFTIEFNYTIKYDGMIGYQAFYPSSPEMSTQHAVYTITTESNNKLRYDQYKCTLRPKTEQIGTSIKYTFEAHNTPALAKETGAAQGDFPKVRLAPTFFELDGLVGNMSSWTEFGKWFHILNTQSLELPEERKAFFKNLVSGEQSDIKKVEILYRYLQENFRYVGIQLGIGGLKTFPAHFVDIKKYGDCKALSNYMQAMLKAVNIRSHYAIINAGEDELPVDKDFVINEFNHVIVCVPLAKDTVWLECTSRNAPFNKLGMFTENRNAFLITDQGGMMVSTPSSSPLDHTINTFSRLKLEEDGSGSAAISLSYSGEFKEQFNHKLFDAPEQEKKEFIFHSFGFKQADKINLQKVDKPDKDYPALLELEYEKLVEFSAGSKHFINPRIYQFWKFALPKIKTTRVADYLITPRVKTDTTILQLPGGYVIEQLPKPVKFTSSLCTYESNYFYNEEKRQIVSSCSIRINTHLIPASKYLETAQFFSDVINEQEQKIVVSKKIN